MKLRQRITLLSIGFLESLIFSGIVFGWANLLYILQEEGVYGFLCTEGDIATQKRLFNNESLNFVNDDERDVSSVPFLEEGELMQGTVLMEDSVEGGKLTLNCIQRAKRFTLIYTVAATMYGLTSIFIGFSLDHFGLWATRISGSLMTIAGFFCLAFTTKDQSWLLWPALNLIALGTNQLKLCVYQFTNLWPDKKSTILFAYGAGFSISATVFTLLQYLYTLGVSFRTLTLPLAILSTLTLPATFLMPVMRVKEHVTKEKYSGGKGLGTKKTSPTSQNLVVPHSDQSKELLPMISFLQNQEETNAEKASLAPAPGSKEAGSGSEREIPLSFSLFSISAPIHVMWHFVNMFMILFYSLSFNTWVYKSTDDSIQVAHYTQVMGICQLTGPLFTPLTGLFTDARVENAKKCPDPVKKLALTIQAPAFATATATLCLIALMTAKLYTNKWAIYSSMVLIAICRPLVHSSCTSYIRLRFPAEHFNRLNGIFTTSVAAVMFVQYPIFIWMFSSDENYNVASVVLIVSLILAIASPGHLFIPKMAEKFATDQLKILERLPKTI